MVDMWAGIDAGKREHHCVVIDGDGIQLLSQRVTNGEDTLLGLIADVCELADGGHVTWAIDLNSGGAALVLTLLANHDQLVFYIPGRIIHHAAATYRGDAKTDAKDAAIIADQARMRRDLTPILASGQLSQDLRMMASHRTDLIGDRVRTINRLRAVLLEYFPALESAFDYSKSKAALILLQGYQTPKALRAMGEARLAKWLHARGARNSATVAERAVNAARSQHSTTPAESYGQTRVRSLAANLTRIDAELAVLEREITRMLMRHEHAETLLSVPGFGPILAADFIANTGGDMSAFGTADRLASVAGLAPAPRDSGRISGNLHRPKRYNRRLLRTCYLAALSSLKSSTASRTFYDRKRGEGKTHKQALIALARRRINVIWALLRDHTTYQEPTPKMA